MGSGRVRELGVLRLKILSAFIGDTNGRVLSLENLQQKIK
jgi:hypothetical protein